MATLIWRKRGEQFFGNDGKVLSGGFLHYLEAGTEIEQTTFANAAGTVANTNPIELDGYGRLPEAVYFGDSSIMQPYKERLTTANGVTIGPWPQDNIPAAVPGSNLVDFAATQMAWVPITTAQSPVTLTAADLGEAYEVDTTAGNVTFNLPSAVDCANRGFVFKKTIAANSLIIDPNGSQVIDDVSTNMTISSRYAVVEIYSNGAKWHKLNGPVVSESLSSTLVNGLTAVTGLADTDEVMLQLASAGAYRKIQAKYLPGTIIAIIEDQKAANTAGGTFTSGADRTRTLSTLAYNRDTLVSLASNQFTVPAGNWTIEWSAPASDVGAHQSLLYNITDTAVTARGSSEFVNLSTTGQTRSFGSCQVTLAGAKAFEIRHRCNTTANTTGFGVAANLGGGEVYTRVVIRKA